MFESMGARAPEDLFGQLVLSGRRPARWEALVGSLLVHVLVLAILTLVPLFVFDAHPPLREDLIRVLIYDPPPPPPPPLPAGSGLASTPRATPPMAESSPAALVAPVVVEPEPAVATAAADDDGGSLLGQPGGTPEGMEEGVPGGVVGGVPGGVLGGVVGGTGTGPVPVMDPDQPPRPLHMARPEYPQQAFVQKVEGVVLLEILIDERGRVASARVVKSIPLLDAAAIAAVRTWIFEPARKRGYPVATLARAPVTFTIF